MLRLYLGSLEECGSAVRLAFHHTGEDCMEASHVVLCFEELQSELDPVKVVVEGVGEHDGQ